LFLFHFVVAPSCSPRLTSVQALSSTSIRVTWSPLKDSRQCRLNGVLRGYKVAYKLNRHRSGIMYQDVKGSDRTTTVVTDLDKYTEYSFQVLAYTVTDGPWGRQAVTRTKEDGTFKSILYIYVHYFCYPKLNHVYYFCFSS